MSFWFISNATAEQKLKFKKPVQYSKFKNVSNAVFQHSPPRQALRIGQGT